MSSFLTLFWVQKGKWGIRQIRLYNNSLEFNFYQIIPLLLSHHHLVLSVFVTVFFQMFFEFFVLLNQVGSQFVIDIIEQFSRRQEFSFSTLLQGFDNFSSVGLSDFSILGFVELSISLLLQVKTQSVEWVVLDLPGFKFIFTSVKNGVIRSRVITELIFSLFNLFEKISNYSISHEFNENGSLFSDDVFSGEFNGLVNSESIVTVNSESIDAIRRTSGSNTVSGILISFWNIKIHFPNQNGLPLGVLMAYLLFLHKNKVWDLRVAGKFKAAWKSPSLAAPSPKKVTATLSCPEVLYP